MTDTPAQPEVLEIPEAVAASRRHWTLPLVWLVPLVAVVIGGWLAVKSILERGPTITISFKTAAGIEAGKTKIRYKDVDMGDVKAIALSPDRSHVIVTAEIVKNAAVFLAEDTRFWVVRPRISGGTVSGLNTLVSGSYIGMDIGQSDKPLRSFTGLETPPIVFADVPGRRFVLHSDNLGSLDIGSPIYFRRIQVGQIVTYDLDKEGTGVTLKAFVNAPYDQYVNENTRFWHASGIDVTLDASGIKVGTESLVSIALGGIAFQTPADSVVLPPAPADTGFTLFANRTAALKHPDTKVNSYLLLFKESARGLSVGAPVDFLGIPVGEVVDVGMDFDPTTSRFQVAVLVYIYPDRLRVRWRNRGNDKDVDPQRIVSAMVERGFRAQLRTGNLLTGQLYVALDFFPGAPKAKVDWDRNPPQVPTMPGSLTELQATLASIATKIDKMPIDDIAAELKQDLIALHRTLDNTDRLVQRLDADVTPELRTVLEEARRTLNSAERTMASDSPLQQDLRQALRELARTAESLRVLGDYLERHPDALIRGKQEGGKP
jgi:paraquat-inducible protein B